MALRVLTISKPYVSAAYRHKFALLAADSRFKIGILCPKAWGSQWCEPESENPPYWFRTLDIRLNGRNHFHTYVGLAAAIDEFAPDVLNVEEEHYSLVTAQAFRLARSRRLPALFYTWQNIAKSYPPPFSWIEKMVFGQAAVGIGGNAESLAILRQKGYRGPLMEIPQMGINLDLFAPKSSAAAERSSAKKSLGLSDHGFLVGFVGRLVEEKGVQVLIEALSMTQNSNINVLILGNGPYASSIKNMAEALGVAARVHFAASVASSQVSSYLKAIDALSLPSLTRPNWKEQFGRVLIEAMAAEAVVLGSSSGEIPRVIGDAGLIHHEGDARMLSAQCDALATNPEQVSELRRRGALRVRQYFTNQMIAEKFGEAFLAASRT